MTIFFPRVCQDYVFTIYVFNINILHFCETTIYSFGFAEIMKVERYLLMGNEKWQVYYYKTFVHIGREDVFTKWKNKKNSMQLLEFV